MTPTKPKKESVTSTVTVEARKNVFHYDELKQGDPKMSNYSWISPKYNPGCLKRLKSKFNPFKKYQVEKELFYMRDGKKVIIIKGDTISFIMENK